MNRTFLIFLVFLFPFRGWSQNISVNTNVPDTTVLLKGVEVLASDQYHPYSHPVEVLDLQRVQSIPTSDASTMLSAISNVGGVRKGPVTLDPVVRGFRAGQLNVQLNGGLQIEGGCPNRMDPTSSHVASDRIASMQVFKGPYAFRYGPNMGGVVRILTIEPKVSSLKGFRAQATKRMESNWNANTENASISWHAPTVAAQAYAGRSKYGDYKSGNGETVSAAFNKYHYGTGVRYQKEKHQITITADASHGYDVHYPALPMDERSDDTWFARTTYRYSANKEFFKHLDLSLFHSNVHHVMDNKERAFSDTVVAVSDIHTSAQGYRIEALFSKENTFWYLGSDGSYVAKDGIRTKTMILQPPVNGNLAGKKEGLWNDAYTMNYGLFTELSCRFSRWFWIAAARGDLNMAGSDTITIKRPGAPTPYTLLPEENKSTFLTYSFSVGASYFFTKNTSLGVSLGRAMRSPDMTERFIIMLPVGYDRYDYLGNPELKPEINHETDITLQHSTANIGNFSAGLFYSYVTNYITAIRIPELPLTADVLGVKQFVNGENAILYGFECGWKSSAQHLIGINWNAALTYGCIYNIEKTTLDEYGQVTGTEVLEMDALAEIPPFETNLTIHLQDPEYKFQPAISLRWAAPQNHVSAAYYEQPSAGFLLVNTTVKYKPVSGAEIVGGVKNLFNTEYYEHLNRRVIGTSVDMPEPGRVWFLQLNLRWK